MTVISITSETIQSSIGGLRGGQNWLKDEHAHTARSFMPTLFEQWLGKNFGQIVMKLFPTGRR
jgi:hypothetical protein